MDGHVGDIENGFGCEDPRQGLTARIDPRLETETRVILAKHNAEDLADMLFAEPHTTHPTRYSNGSPRSAGRMLRSD